MHPCIQSKRDATHETSPSSVRRELLSFLKTILIFVAAAIILRASVVEAFKIPSGSMIPALMIGDHLLVTKYNYGLRLPFVKRSLWQWAMPKRGDIVVFTREDDPHTPDQDESEVNIIKRVIGLPGDMIEVRDRTVYLNNKVYTCLLYTSPSPRDS